MAEKESRLSSRARELIDGARQRKYVAVPEKAVKYLLDAGTNGLTPYDKQRVGREILRRFDGKGQWTEEGIKRIYGLSNREGEQPVSLGNRKFSKSQADEMYAGTEGTVEGINFTEKSPHASVSAVLPKGDKETWEFVARGYDIAAEGYRGANLPSRVAECYRKSAVAYRRAGDEERAKYVEGKLEEVTKRGAGFRRQLSSLASIVCILSGIFFLSTNVTGNAISNLTNSTTNFLGAGLLIVGLVAGFFWMKSRKSN